MSRMVGTVSMGIRAPIIRSGDDLVEIVTNSVLEAAREGALTVRDRDVICMTEAIVARAQGNYASVDDIAADVRAKLGGETVGVIFPILSRNRFAICLRGIAKGAKKIVLMLSYPSDEVGNHLIDVDVMDEKGVDPYKDVLTLEQYRALFGYTTHPFTGVDYVDYYSNLIRECGVLNRLSETAQNDLANLITLLLGITIAFSMRADQFVTVQTIMIMALGLVAFIFDTVAGVVFAKILNIFSRTKINPMVGAAGISAFPMSARIVEKMGIAENNQNHLLMHAVGANVSGQIASAVAGGIILGFFM